MEQGAEGKGACDSHASRGADTGQPAPTPSSTTTAVRRRILRSISIDCCLTYTVSHLTQSSNVTLPRAVTCHSPVIPGLTCRRMSRQFGAHRISSRINGLGPTRLISPLRTLINCGNSSRLVRLRMRPTRVTRGSPNTLKVGPSTVERYDGAARFDRRTNALGLIRMSALSPIPVCCPLLMHGR